MRIKILNNTAFTLLEILLAAIIFIVTIAGVFTTLNAVRAPVINKENALSAAVFGKQVLEYLRSQVSASSSANYYNNSTTACSGSGNSIICTDLSLALGTHQVPSGNLPSVLSWPSTALSNANLLNGNPTLTYTVSCGDGSTPSGTPPDCSSPDIAREVNLGINWPDTI